MLASSVGTLASTVVEASTIPSSTGITTVDPPQANPTETPTNAKRSGGRRKMRMLAPFEWPHGECFVKVTWRMRVGLPGTLLRNSREVAKILGTPDGKGDRRA
jgi:hypothetical protein